ncbi:hypothetical protein BDQ17DRAFT_1267525, partial [Cyathus striatus]
EEARELGANTLYLRIEILSEEHPGTLESMSNLSDIYLKEGNWKEAETLQKKAFQITCKVFGDKHILTLTALYKLGCTYWHTNNLKRQKG